MHACKCCLSFAPGQRPRGLSGSRTLPSQEIVRRRCMQGSFKASKSMGWSNLLCTQLSPGEFQNQSCLLKAVRRMCMHSQIVEPYCTQVIRSCDTCITTRQLAMTFSVGQAAVVAISDAQTDYGSFKQVRAKGQSCSMRCNSSRCMRQQNVLSKSSNNISIYNIV